MWLNNFIRRIEREREREREEIERCTWRSIVVWQVIPREVPYGLRALAAGVVARTIARGIRWRRESDLRCDRDQLDLEDIADGYQEQRQKARDDDFFGGRCCGGWRGGLWRGCCCGWCCERRALWGRYIVSLSVEVIPFSEVDEKAVFNQLLDIFQLVLPSFGKIIP